MTMFIPIISSFLLIVLAMVIYLSIVKTKYYINHKNVIDVAFALALGLLSIHSCLFGLLKYDDQEYAMVFIIAFISGLILDLKCNIIVIIITMAALILSVSSFDSKLTISVDIVVSILSAVLGYIAKRNLFKKTWPPISSSFVFSFALTTIYMIATLLMLTIKHAGVVFDSALLRYLIKLVQNTISVLIIFIILNVFFKRVDENESNMLSISLFKKFSIMLPILFCIFTALGYYLFFIDNMSMTKRYLRFRTKVAKEKTSELVGIYGNNFMENKEAKVLYSNWFIGDFGALFVIDSKGNIRNEIDEKYVKMLNSDNLIPKNFAALDSYPSNQIIEYKEDGKKLLAIYYKEGEYKILLFVPMYEVFFESATLSNVASYIIVALTVIIFIIVHLVIKRSITNRLQNVNEKLKQITEGEYDVRLDDNSSTELKMLSHSINQTVSTLKSKIEEVKKKDSQELEFARKLQVAQLPTFDDCRVAGNIYGENIPAEDVGGDFYDFFSIGARLEAFLIADVSGKGIPGAMFMMRAKNTIRNVVLNSENLETAITAVNKLLYENNNALMFVTCFIALINKIDGKLIYINAGHNPPILCKRNESSYDYSFIDTTISPMLAIDEESKYTAVYSELNIGDGLLLYTDGIPEARNRGREFFTLDKLLAEVKKHDSFDPKMMCKDVISAVKDFSNGAEQHDDITVLAFKYNGNYNEIKINAIECEISKGRRLIDQFCELYNVDVEDKRNLKVVYDEIFTNIMKYAYKNNGGDIIFKLNNLENKIEMIFVDNGPMFDSVSYNSTDINKNAEDKINGGMGIMFCKNIMSEMKYERKDNQNILKMYKEI